MNKLLGSIGIAAAAIAAVPASAATINFTTGSAPTWTSGTTTVTASGWTISPKAGTTSVTADATVYASTLQQWSAGLGVANSSFDVANTNEHTVDNRGGYDFVLLQFNQAVQLTGMTLNAYTLPGNYYADKDAWVSFTNMNLNSTPTSTLLGNVLGNQKGYDSYHGADGVFPSFAGTFSKTWLIGAALTTTDRDDAFKLAGISFNVAAVPEPSTWATMLVGFALIGGAMRRRNAGKLATA